MLNTRGLLRYVPPALLIAVACQQLALSRSSDLSAWKGGGFGMFATVDMPAHRIIRGFLVAEGRQIPIDLAGADRLAGPLEQALTLPSEARLDSLAEALGRELWAVDSGAARPVQRAAPSQRVVPSAIRVEVYRIRFDPATLRVERVFLADAVRDFP